MDDLHINTFADELDRAVPKEGAKVDWRGEELVANKQGLLRLAVEFLFAATEPLKEGRDITKRDWAYLWVRPPIGDDDFPVISRICRTDRVELPPPPPPTTRDKIKKWFVVSFFFAVFLFLLTSMVVGCVAILKNV